MVSYWLWITDWCVWVSFVVVVLEGVVFGGVFVVWVLVMVIG